MSLALQADSLSHQKGLDEVWYIYAMEYYVIIFQWSRFTQLDFEREIYIYIDIYRYRYIDIYMSYIKKDCKEQILSFLLDKNLGSHCSKTNSWLP